MTYIKKWNNKQEKNIKNSKNNEERDSNKKRDYQKQYNKEKSEKCQYPINHQRVRSLDYIFDALMDRLKFVTSKLVKKLS